MHLAGIQGRVVGAVVAAAVATVLLMAQEPERAGQRDAASTAPLAVVARMTVVAEPTGGEAHLASQASLAGSIAAWIVGGSGRARGQPRAAQ